MKKLVLFAAALAALVACNKEEAASTDSFVKGQKVILNISAPSTTKVTSELNATSGDVSFKWEADDEIKVTVGGEPATFTLKSGAGESSATFEGQMPGSGSSFDVQYPYNAPDITSQTYSSTEAIPHDMMLFTATNCQMSAPQFTLAGQNALLRLNLWSTDKTISKIDIKNTSSGTITLNITGGVALPTTEATAKAFFIVVPGSKDGISYQFTADIFDNAATPAKICSFTPSAAQTFTNGEIRNMPAKEVTASSSPTTGTAKAIIEGKEVDVNWVQLWKDGPKFAKCNYGADLQSETKIGEGVSWSVACSSLWGSNWKLPSKVEMDLLNEDKVTCTYCKDGGVYGFKFTGKQEGYTNNYIFITAKGDDELGQLNLWSSTLNPDETEEAAYKLSLFYDEDGLFNTWGSAFTATSKACCRFVLAN